jgi:hypothetical protein
MHAYEGGHQDHDAAHILGVRAAQRSGTLQQSRQFTLYRASQVPLLPFAMFRPLPANGAVEQIPLTVRERVRYLYLCTLYRSQVRTLLGLWPMIAMEYMLHGMQLLQPVSIARLVQRPHEGPLLYEQRRRGSFVAFERAARSLAAIDGG